MAQIRLYLSCYIFCLTNLSSWCENLIWYLSELLLKICRLTFQSGRSQKTFTSKKKTWQEFIAAPVKHLIRIYRIVNIYNWSCSICYASKALTWALTHSAASLYVKRTKTADPLYSFTQKLWFKNAWFYSTAIKESICFLCGPISIIVFRPGQKTDHTASRKSNTCRNDPAHPDIKKRQITAAEFQ